MDPAYNGDQSLMAAPNFNIAWCIANSICLVARKPESHSTLQILNE